MRFELFGGCSEFQVLTGDSRWIQSMPSSLLPAFTNDAENSTGFQRLGDPGIRNDPLD